MRSHHIQHKNLAVADPSRARGAGDGGDGILHPLVRQRHLDLELGQEGNGVFGAAIDFGMALLAAITAHLGHRHAVHADFGERQADAVQAVRLDNGDDEFHAAQSFLPSD